MQNDPLYHFLLNCLNSTELAALNSEEFCTQVSYAYLELLKRKGLNIPASEHETTLESIREDVWMFYRMKTYGFYNLSDFQQNKKKAS